MSQFRVIYHEPICPDCGSFDIEAAEVDTGDGLTETAHICRSSGAAWPLACVTDWTTPAPAAESAPATQPAIGMQGIGFVDEVSPDELTVITKRIADRLRDVPLPMVTFDRPTVARDAVYFKAHPAEPIYELRLATYQAIASAFDTGQFQEAPPTPEQYTPHVSAAYVNSDGPAQPIVDALNNVQDPSVTTTFRTASILTFHRDHQMYEWTDAVPVPIGQ